MRIFLTGGHKMYEGAKGFLDETEVDRELVKNLGEILKNMGHEVTVYNAETSKDYVEEVGVANKSNYDWYLDVHANAYQDATANGFEVLVYRDDKKQAHDICNNMSKLGFRNRGVKIRQDLYSLKNTKAKALYIESFFVTNKKDCELYRNIGARAIASAIAEGLTGQKYLSGVCPTCGK